MITGQESLADTDPSGAAVVVDSTTETGK